ncbi:glycosyltransferase family 2 protein [Flavobacteriaceae bacterium]|nr:glycosyltransferase family 2 protein [Flavobacteriaceae bacterium]
MKTELKNLSIVIPCFNEEEVLQHTYTELKNIISGISNINKHQFIFVNNGSTDKTLDVLINLKTNDNNIKILDLRNNYGYQGSITAGLYNADHEMIISIDADLQDDPNKIQEMINHYYDGFEMVLGVRKNRGVDSFFKRFFTLGFYNFLSILGVKTVYNHGDFRLLSKKLVEDLKIYNEKNRYLRGIILKLENKFKCVYYDRKKRTRGKSKFRPLDLINLALDGITSFSVLPIKLIFISGILMFILSLLLLSVLVFAYFKSSIIVEGWTSTIFLILFFGGIQNIYMGILGEYISKTYIETKSRPIYQIRKIY